MLGHNLWKVFVNFYILRLDSLDNSAFFAHVYVTVKTTFKQCNNLILQSLVCIDYKHFTSKKWIWWYIPDFPVYDDILLNHTSVVSLRHHCAATRGIAADCCGFLLLFFAFSGSIWVQHVLQYVFAFTRGQIVEEVEWRHLNKPKMTNRNDICCKRWKNKNMVNTFLYIYIYIKTTQLLWRF